MKTPGNFILERFLQKYTLEPAKNICHSTLRHRSPQSSILVADRRKCKRNLIMKAKKRIYFDSSDEEPQNQSQYEKSHLWPGQNRFSLKQANKTKSEAKNFGKCRLSSDESVVDVPGYKIQPNKNSIGNATPPRSFKNLFKHNSSAVVPNTSKDLVKSCRYSGTNKRTTTLGAFLKQHSLNPEKESDNNTPTDPPNTVEDIKTSNSSMIVNYNSSEHTEKSVSQKEIESKIESSSFSGSDRELMVQRNKLQSLYKVSRRKKSIQSEISRKKSGTLPRPPKNLEKKHKSSGKSIGISKLDEFFKKYSHKMELLNKSSLLNATNEANGSGNKDLKSQNSSTQNNVSSSSDFSDKNGFSGEKNWHTKPIERKRSDSIGKNDDHQTIFRYFKKVKIHGKIQNKKETDANIDINWENGKVEGEPKQDLKQDKKQRNKYKKRRKSSSSIDTIIRKPYSKRIYDNIKWSDWDSDEDKNVQKHPVKEGLAELSFMFKTIYTPKSKFPPEESRRLANDSTKTKKSSLQSSSKKREEIPFLNHRIADSSSNNENNELKQTNSESVLKNIRSYIDLSSGRCKQGLESNQSHQGKSQWNLLSSEGFYETMCFETPTGKIDESQRETVQGPNSWGLTNTRNDNHLLKKLSQHSPNLFNPQVPVRIERSTYPQSKTRSTVSGLNEKFKGVNALEKIKRENENYGKRGDINSKEYSNDKDMVQKSSPCNINIAKATSSDPISFGSSSCVFSGNDIASQTGRGSFLHKELPKAKNTFTFNEMSSENVTNKSRSVGFSHQKRGKFDSRTLKDLCKLHESNTWEFPSLSQKFKSNSRLFEDAPKENGQNDLTRNMTVQENNNTPTLSPESITIPSLHGEKYSKPKYTAVSQLNWSSGTSNLHSQKSRKGKINNSHESELQNTFPSFTIKNEHLIAQPRTHFGSDNIFQPAFENIFTTKPRNYQHHVFHIPLLKQSGSQTQSNCEDERESEGLLTQTQESGSQQQAKRKSRNTYNITENCILYKDNLLKELLEDKVNILKASNKSKLERTACEESGDILAKTYLKSRGSFLHKELPKAKNTPTFNEMSSENVTNKSRTDGFSHQKRDKFDSRTLKDLCKLHESNTWESPSLSQKFESNSRLFEDAPKENGQNDLTRNMTVQENNNITTLSPESITIPSLHGEQYSKPKYTAVSQLNWSSGTSNLHSQKSRKGKINNSHESELQNTFPSFTIKNEHLIAQPRTHFGSDNIFQPAFENIFTTKPRNYQHHVFHIPLLKQSGSQTQSNCEDERESEGLLTQTQESGSQQQAKRKSRNTYNITENCILYEDNLLKELLEDKVNILKVSNKSKLKRTASEESGGILAKTYLKRYKKDKMKIFKIKRRVRKEPVENYQPPEEKIMDRFIKRLNNGFTDEFSESSEDCESIATPSSYITDDETTSEVLSTGSAKLSDHQKLLREGMNKLSKDRTLLFSRFSDSAPKEFDSPKILDHIREIIGGILADYEHGRYPCIKIPRTDSNNCVFQDERYQLKDAPEYSTVTYKYNYRRTKFNLMLFILNKIRVLLETGTKVTKREMFYQLKTMISYQSTTDAIIRDISRMLNVGMWALNVTAQKGLVYGNLKLVMENGETINCNVPGTLVPKDVSQICEIQSNAYFILVVEKESIFHKLLEENLPNRLTRPFILVTGKGFPDLNTQLFLKKLWMVMTIPVFILVDADPDGIAIMLNYRFGSVANAHVSEHLAIPKARWIGVFPSEVQKLALTHETLNQREIGKTQKLLQLQCVQENENIRQQLETLLESGAKTGIESLMKTETYLSHRYLSFKFYSNDLI